VAEIKKNNKTMTTKEILLEELYEQVHPEDVEQVIFLALDYYAQNAAKSQWATIVASVLRDRIKEEASDFYKE
jgi:hypothetical protein